MRYEKLKTFTDEEFRRLTGVKRATFDKMVLILKEAEAKKKLLGGKPNHLTVEDRLLNGPRISQRISDLFSYSKFLLNFRKRLL